MILTPYSTPAEAACCSPSCSISRVNTPVWPDAQPWDTLFFVIAVAVMAMIHRKTMFQRGMGVTVTLLPEGVKTGEVAAIYQPAQASKG